MRIINAVKKAEKLQRESKFTKALLIYEKIDKNLNSNSFDKEWLYYLRLNEGHCARLAGSFKKAIRYYNLALKLAKRIDEVSVADALSGMGTTLRAIGKLEQAVKSFDVAYEIYKRLNDIEGQAYILWAKGGTFRFMGLIDHAFKSFKEAFVIYKSLGNKAGMGYSLCGLGGASRVMGNFEESLEYYTEANK
ncbi:MAG: tetratricopeptide repeat protein, partial [Candidatus Kryptonium sp.]